ncbi:unnamed protein product [Dovyalis caffra]|uniref:Uncharacterized protein n=1 Tax=Dovyalis caffra TaxID=77055 RepID=A0AAV1QTJ8_9ROSI|nr:unnamed protein product [Dovyalis caffra]
MARIVIWLELEGLPEEILWYDRHEPGRDLGPTMSPNMSLDKAKSQKDKDKGSHQHEADLRKSLHASATSSERQKRA